MVGRTPGPHDDPQELGTRAEGLDREQEFSRIIASYLSAVDAGERPDREAILREHPDLADRLKSYFAGEDELGAFEAGTRPVSLSDEEETEPETEFADYELLEEIARGGMGVVYKARQKSLRRLVALKMIVGGKLANSEIVSRFYREAQAVARLDHPNIVPIYEIGEHEGQHYFSMKLFEGGSLFDLRESFRAQPRAAVEMIKNVAWAVHYAHLSGILHRDLKPANILLDRAGRPHVADFGLARAVTSEASLSLTDTGAILGTPLYMAPEQAMGDKARWGPAMDVYSLGAMLYEFLTGRPPFIGKTPVDILRAVIEEDPPLARTVHPRVPLDLQTICAKCLEKDPSKRYASAAELAEDLDRFLRHETIRARPPGLVRRIGKAAVRNRVATAVILVACAMAAIFGAGAWYRAARKFDEAVASARKALDEGRLERAAKGLSYLQEAYGDAEAVTRLALDITRAMYSEGASQSEEYLERKARILELENRWDEEKEKSPPWQPPWERQVELAAWHEYTLARQGKERYYNDAVQTLRRARRVAPRESAELREIDLALAGLLLDKFEEGRRFGAALVSPAFFKEEIEALELDELEGQLEGGAAAFETDPPGAEVYCFRYESFEGRLLPLPFDPAAGAVNPEEGLLGRPFLEVERIEEETIHEIEKARHLLRPPFEVGDRWLEVDGRTVGLVGELAEVLRDVAADESVEVIVRRGGRKRLLAWTPFPRALYAAGPSNLVPGRLLNVRAQFGFSFVGYPLDFKDGCRAGVTESGSPLGIDVPEGSYLFVLRKEGYRDTRFPVAVPGGATRSRIRLLRESDIPSQQEFVYIPEGPFVCGGDKDAFQSRDISEEPVGSFFIGRFEVTVGEYLEFLNDEDVIARTNPESGTATPALDVVRRELAEAGERTLRIVPRAPRSWRFRRNTWETSWDPTRPIFDISQLAALEYAHWRTGKQEIRKWRFRLPTDLEWEKAARGVDRRTFVWGNYFFWSYCWSYQSERFLGSQEKSQAPPFGSIYLTDESVYGVRDLAGSLGELTDDKPRKHYRYTSIRGGDWYNSDEYYYHVATRNSRFPERSGSDVGFRLAADLLGTAEAQRSRRKTQRRE